MKLIYHYRILSGCFILWLFLFNACTSGTNSTEPHTSNNVTSTPLSYVSLPESVSVTRNSTERPDPIRGLITLYAATEYEHADSIIDFDPPNPFNLLENAMSDLNFIERENNGENSFFLKPINGTVAIGVETQSHDYSVCEEAISYFRVNEISTTEENAYICLLTDKGNLVSLKIESLHYAGQGSISIEYVLWESNMSDLAKDFATKFPVTNTPVPPSPTPLPPTSTPSLFNNNIVTGFFHLQSQKFEFLPDQVQRTLNLDLDTNVLTYDMNGDVYYFKDCGSNCFYSLRPVNEAKMLVWEESEPTIEECQNELDEFSTTLQFVSIGYYVCALTNDDHISILHIEGMSTGGEDTWIEISFSTYIQ